MTSPVTPRLAIVRTVYSLSGAERLPHGTITYPERLLIEPNRTWKSLRRRRASNVTGEQGEHLQQ